MLPFLIGGALLGAAAYIFSDDDEEPKRRSNRSAVQNSYDNDKKEEIKKGIDVFSEASIQRIKSKYNVDIDIDHKLVSVIKQDHRLRDMIQQKQNKVNDLDLVLKQLDQCKHESIR